MTGEQQKPKRRRPTPTNVATADRMRQALELRKAGVTFEQIATRLGFSDRGAAYKAICRALEETLTEPAEELRTLETERLDRLLLAVWKPALEGDLKAVDRVLRILESRRKLLGLDAPVSLQIGETILTYRLEAVEMDLDRI